MQVHPPAGSRHHSLGLALFFDGRSSQELVQETYTYAFRFVATYVFRLGGIKVPGLVDTCGFVCTYVFGLVETYAFGLVVLMRFGSMLLCYFACAHNSVNEQSLH